MLKKFFLRVSEMLGNAQRNSIYNMMLADGSLKVGAGTYGVPYIYNYTGSEATVTIGHYTSIGPGVTIVTGGIHPIKAVSQFPFRSVFGMEGAYRDGNPSTKGNIQIGSDVWLCAGVTVLSGVTIGDGAVVYNNAVVNSNIPPYAIAAGLPAKVIGYRFDEVTINELMQIKWWNWPEAKIREQVNLLTSENIADFIARQNSN